MKMTKERKQAFYEHYERFDYNINDNFTDEDIDEMYVCDTLDEVLDYFNVAHLEIEDNIEELAMMCNYAYIDNCKGVSYYVCY